MKNILIEVMVVLCLTRSALPTDAPCGQQGFYIFAHMTNSIASVNWAVAQGANGVEVDLRFSPEGNPIKFHHGSPCDCICKCPLPGTCNSLASSSVCAALETGSGQPCDAEAPAVDLLELVATKASIAAIYIDSKVEASAMNATIQAVAGQNAVQLLVDHLFAKGYNGKVIFNSPYRDTMAYLNSAVASMNTQPAAYKNRVFYTIDGEEGDVVPTLQSLTSIASTNLVYTTGSSSCLPKILLGPDTFHLALSNQAVRVVGLSALWTIDLAPQIKAAFNYFGAILTNEPKRARDLAIEAGLPIATQCSAIPQASGAAIITDEDAYECDCDSKSFNGCKISKAAPANTACKCIAVLPITCTGTVVACRDPNAAKCAAPDKTIESCRLGSGNCKAY